MQNVISWFEIPVHDMARATRFYEAMIGAPLTLVDFMGVPHAVLPGREGGGAGGALVADPQTRPTRDGALLYLSAGAALEAWLARAADAGGTIELPSTSIGEMGDIAILVDSEGNRVGLHRAREA